MDVEATDHGFVCRNIISNTKEDFDIINYVSGWLKGRGLEGMISMSRDTTYSKTRLESSETFREARFRGKRPAILKI
jgi:hypothetical protein